MSAGICWAPMFINSAHTIPITQRHINALNYPAMIAREAIENGSCLHWLCVYSFSIDDVLICSCMSGVDLMANVQWKLFNKDSGVLGCMIWSYTTHLNHKKLSCGYTLIPVCSVHSHYVTENLGSEHFCLCTLVTVTVYKWEKHMLNCIECGLQASTMHLMWINSP